VYAQYKFLTTDKLERNLLSAVMTSFDFNGFEETSDALVGFIDNTLLSQDEVKAVLDEYGLAFIPFEYSTIEEVNWNESWEKNFSPIVIDDVCIRATFHPRSQLHQPKLSLILKCLSAQGIIPPQN
jgi:ribosomal protein L11 methyltransferase